MNISEQDRLRLEKLLATTYELALMCKVIRRFFLMMLRKHTRSLLRLW